jgi:hypothetical protein
MLRHLSQERVTKAAAAPREREVLPSPLDRFVRRLAQAGLPGDVALPIARAAARRLVGCGEAAARPEDEEEAALAALADALPCSGAIQPGVRSAAAAAAAMRPVSKRAVPIMAAIISRLPSTVSTVSKRASLSSCKSLL